MGSHKRSTNFQIPRSDLKPREREQSFSRTKLEELTVVIKGCHRNCDLLRYAVSIRSDIFKMKEHTLEIHHALDIKVQLDWIQSVRSFRRKAEGGKEGGDESIPMAFKKG